MFILPNQSTQKSLIEKGGYSPKLLSHTYQDKNFLQRKGLNAAIDGSVFVGAVSPILSRNSLLQNSYESKSFLKPKSLFLDRTSLPDARIMLKKQTASLEPQLPRRPSECSEMVFIRACLLSGEEVCYPYVAVNLEVDGKETQVLHTDHPKPKFKQGFSISEQQSIKSSTGLYRTVIGEIPPVLTVDASQESLSSSFNYKNKIVCKSLNDSNPNNVTSLCSVPGKKDSILSNCSSNDEGVASISNSDDCEFILGSDSGTLQKNLSLGVSKAQENNCIDSTEEKATQKINLTERILLEKNTEKRSQNQCDCVKVMPRNQKQVVITKALKKDSESSSEGDCHSHSSLTALWLSKHVWPNQLKKSSLRSVSADSGYKQSSIDENCEENTEPFNEHENISDINVALT